MHRDALAPFTRQSWLFVPPLDQPLELRMENGRFGALRPKPLPGPPPCATTQIIPADDPRNPTGTDVHCANQIHEAVDLAAAAGDCVFAAYSGRVVEVEANPAGTRGNVTIDHHPRGLGVRHEVQPPHRHRRRAGGLRPEGHAVRAPMGSPPSLVGGHSPPRSGP